MTGKTEPLKRILKQMAQLRSKLKVTSYSGEVNNLKEELEAMMLLKQTMHQDKQSTDKVSVVKRPSDCSGLY
jgi:hypothetical protein